MEEIFDTEPDTKDKAELSRQIDQYLEALRRNVEQMARDREEIDRLKAETWALLDQMRKAA